MWNRESPQQTHGSVSEPEKGILPGRCNIMNFNAEWAFIDEPCCRVYIGFIPRFNSPRHRQPTTYYTITMSSHALEGPYGSRWYGHGHMVCWPSYGYEIERRWAPALSSVSACLFWLIASHRHRAHMEAVV